MQIKSFATFVASVVALSVCAVSFAQAPTPTPKMDKMKGGKMGKMDKMKGGKMGKMDKMKGGKMDKMKGGKMGKMDKMKGGKMATPAPKMAPKM